jgi:lysophospholipase L1-like esterase
MTIRLAFLGDSVAAGDGASLPDDRLCARVLEALARHGFETIAEVFAVSGASSAALRAQVDRALRWEPHVAVIVIGANDLSHQIPPDQAARQLARAVRRLRATGTEVVVAPVPDLSSVPRVPPKLRRAVRAASARLRDRQISVTTAEGGRVADPDGVTSTAFAADPALFSSDRFHPSSAGYAVIADALLPEVLAAVGTVHARHASSAPAASPATRTTP